MKRNFDTKFHFRLCIIGMKKTRNLAISEEQISSFQYAKDDILLNSSSRRPQPSLHRSTNKHPFNILSVSDDDTTHLNNEIQNNSDNIIMIEEKKELTPSQKLKEVKKMIRELNSEVEKSKDKQSIVEEVERELYLSLSFPSDYILFVQQRKRKSKPNVTTDITTKEEEDNNNDDIDLALFRRLFDPTFVSFIVRSIRSLRPLPLLSSSKVLFLPSSSLLNY